MPMLSSCSKDFLKEDLTTKRSTQYFETNEGIESLAVGLYQYLRFYSTSEAGYSLMNYGTDEFTEGADNSNGPWNSYNSSLCPTVVRVNTNTVAAGTLWDYMYTGINIANTLIERVESGKYTGNDKAFVAGTGYFMRGLHYYNLVTQYGGCPLKLEPSTSVSFEFERADVKDVADQVISDLKAAYDILPSKASKQGEITKDAAAHFLAKAYLWRASEINDSWNGSTKSADLDAVIKYSDEVISHHKLATNFADLWRYTKPNDVNESLDEIVLAAQFTEDSSTWNVGGTLNFYSCSQYRDLPGFYRDRPGGREYNRLRTTYYTIYNYDLVNDSRFWKAFRTKMNMCTKAGPGADYEGTYVPGQTRGLMYVVNQPGDTRFETVRTGIAEKKYVKDFELGTNVGTTMVFFPKGATRYDIPMEQPNYQGSNGNKYFPSCTKYMDGGRVSIADSHSYRDHILARSAESYFNAAEAYIRKGDYASAAKYLNTIRERAAWKAGEDRAKHEDGGAAWYNTDMADAQVAGVSSYCDRNSYYESNNIAVTTAASDLKVSGDISVAANLPAPDQEVVKKLGYTAPKDVALCFLLNEKSREMSLELVRWVDLARTKTLIARCKAYNKEAAANITDKHYLRPLPQTYLDVLKRDGKSLTKEEKQAIQNPGY